MMKLVSRSRVQWHRFVHSQQGRFGIFTAGAALVVGSCAPQCTPAAPSSSGPPAAPAAAAPAAAAPAAPGASAVPPAGAQFFEDFSTAGSVNRFEWQVHVGGASMGARLGNSAADGNPNVPWAGEHNAACAGPDTLRDVRGGQTTGDPVGEVMWWCAPGGDSAKGHVMTAVDTGSVAVLSFSPPQAFSGVSRVCWDQNANNLGGGKWANMFIVPASHVAANGGRIAYSGQVGLDPEQILLPGDAITVVEFTGNMSAWQGQTQILNEGSPNPEDMAATPAPRFQTCVQDLRNGTIRFSIVRPSGATEVFDRAGSFPAGPVRVIWQDSAYSPAKHVPSGHLTWHWDNIAIS